MISVLREVIKQCLKEYDDIKGNERSNTSGLLEQYVIDKYTLAILEMMEHEGMR